MSYCILGLFGEMDQWSALSQKGTILLAFLLWPREQHLRSQINWLGESKIAVEFWLTGEAGGVKTT